MLYPDLAFDSSPANSTLTGEPLSDTTFITLPPVQNVGQWPSSNVSLVVSLQSAQNTLSLTQTIVISSLAVGEARAILTTWPSLVKGTYTLSAAISSDTSLELDFNPSNNEATYQVLVPGYSIYLPIISQAPQQQQRSLISPLSQQGKIRY